MQSLSSKYCTPDSHVCSLSLALAVATTKRRNMSTPPKKTTYTYMLRDRSSDSAGTSASTTSIKLKRKVMFSSDEESRRLINDDEQSVSSDESFCEILTSAAEPLSSYGEEDIETLDMAFERAYTCSHRCFQARAVEPVERSSLLLLDKDILAMKGMYSSYIHTSFFFRLWLGRGKRALHAHAPKSLYTVLL